MRTDLSIMLSNIAGIEPSLTVKTWSELSIGEYAVITQCIPRIFPTDTDCCPIKDLNSSLHRAAAALFLEYFKQPGDKVSRVFYSFFSSLFLQHYANAVNRYFESNVPHRKGLMPVDQFCDYAKDIIINSPCNVQHPIFGYLHDVAPIKDLAQVLWDENLADLNFANIVLFLLYSAKGTEGMEMSSNFFDEIGRLNDDGRHVLMREEMMRSVGLPIIAGDWCLDTYPIPAIFHFNRLLKFPPTFPAF